MDKKYVARFWSYVDVGDPDECWEWSRFRDKDGYGYYAKPRGEIGCWIASRLAWVLSNRWIPPSVCVLHSCDNPPCCNPRHLFTGDRQDNSDDMMRKGRLNSRKGSLNNWAKLVESDVVKIRRLAAAKVPRKKLARQYHVCKATIDHVVTRRSWAHVD